MILFPPAKINLGLRVHSKRSDGFHELESCMFELPLHDVLEVLPSRVLEFHSTGLSIDGEQENNLCVRAFRLLQSEHNIDPVYIHLRKIIPMGAGLGGGSADATYVLLALNTIYNLKLSIDQLKDYAAQLGSDCAFFVEGGVQYSEGRGEVLSPLNLDLSGKYIKIVNPGIHINTAEAFANVDHDVAKGQPSVKEVLKKPVSVWKEKLINSFESYVFGKYSEVELLKNKMYDQGAEYSAMSGSGSTIYGIYDQKPEAFGESLEWVFPIKTK